MNPTIYMILFCADAVFFPPADSAFMVKEDGVTFMVMEDGVTRIITE